MREREWYVRGGCLVEGRCSLWERDTREKGDESARASECAWWMFGRVCASGLRRRHRHTMCLCLCQFVSRSLSPSLSAKRTQNQSLLELTLQIREDGMYQRANERARGQCSSGVRVMSIKTYTILEPLSPPSCVRTPQRHAALAHHLESFGWRVVLLMRHLGIVWGRHAR